MKVLLITEITNCVIFREPHKNVYCPFYKPGGDGEWVCLISEHAENVSAAQAGNRSLQEMMFLQCPLPKVILGPE